MVIANKYGKNNFKNVLTRFCGDLFNPMYSYKILETDVNLVLLHTQDEYILLYIHMHIHTYMYTHTHIHTYISVAQNFLGRDIVIIMSLQYKQRTNKVTAVQKETGKIIQQKQKYPPYIEVKYSTYEIVHLLWFVICFNLFVRFTAEAEISYLFLLQCSLYFCLCVTFNYLLLSCSIGKLSMFHTQ